MHEPLSTTLRAVFSLLFGAGLVLAGYGLLGTLVATGVGARGGSGMAAGVVMSCYFAGLTVGSLRVDRLITRVGHIRAFTAFAALLAAVTLLHALWASVLVWAVLRFVSGFAMAGFYMTVESWLNARSSSERRGQILSMYMVTVYGSLGLGQMLFQLHDPGGTHRFMAAGVLVALGVIPLALTSKPAPPIERVPVLSVRALWARAEVGLAATLVGGAMVGAIFGMAPIYAQGVGLSDQRIATFMTVLVFSGMFFQWPIGLLSDRGDRRKVLAGVSIGVLASGLGMAALGDGPFALLLVLALAFGGLAFTIYPVAVAQVMDRVEHDEMRAAAGALVLASAVGSTAGPLLGAIGMDLLGPPGLFAMVAVLAGGLASYASWRIDRSAAVAPADQEAFAPVPRTSPEVVELDPRSHHEVDRGPR